MIRSTPRAPAPRSWRTVRGRARILIVVSVLLSACGVFQQSPTQRGDWGWMLSEHGQWAHEPGQPYYEAYEATRRHWNANADELGGRCDNRRPRLEVIEHDGPVYYGQANGYVASSTAKRAVIVINTAHGPEVSERLAIHEMVHVCGFWAGVGAGRLHEDPLRWNPARTSVEAKATCELQGRLCPED